MAGAKPDAVFMHDMPAYRGIEVTSSVIDGPQSIIYDQVGCLCAIQACCAHMHVGLCIYLYGWVSVYIYGLVCTNICVWENIAFCIHFSTAFMTCIASVNIFCARLVVYPRDVASIVNENKRSAPVSCAHSLTQAENRQHAQKAVVLHLMGVDVQFPFV